MPLRYKCLHKRYWDSFPSFVIRLAVYLKNTTYYCWVSGVLCSFLKIYQAIHQSIKYRTSNAPNWCKSSIPTPTPPLKPLSILSVISTLSSIFEPSVWNQNDATNRLYYLQFGRTVISLSKHHAIGLSFCQRLLPSNFWQTAAPCRHRPCRPPASTRRWPNLELMLVQRRRRFVFVGSSACRRQRSLIR